MNLIFDTHAHYDDEVFDADREALLASMPENGVGLIVDPGCDLDTSRRAVEIAEQYPHVYAAVGCPSQTQYRPPDNPVKPDRSYRPHTVQNPHRSVISGETTNNCATFCSNVILSMIALESASLSPPELLLNACHESPPSAL